MTGICELIWPKSALLSVGRNGASFTTLWPDLDEEDALVVASIRSISGDSIHADNWRTRPFRQPHHSSSAAALVGGGCHFS
ncbi:ATP-binding protein [Glaciecola sp. XM2]|uniref:ATP-binding protein n=1 Tax=Glaciecola sp. XM2 TaxID=1914931 RepID=UPI0020322732|nr:ATP-binding protein [Glaciecola sp. XM2]